MAIQHKKGLFGYIVIRVDLIGVLKVFGLVGIGVSLHLMEEIQMK